MNPARALPVEPPRLLLLGGCELRIAARAAPLDFPYDKVRLLLALLALDARAWPRERLAELLWPQSEAAQARANLRRAIFDLRHALAPLEPLAPPLLGDNKKQLALNPALGWRVDALDFAAAPAPDDLAALAQHLTLYRGPLLDGLALDGLAALQDWLAPRREALLSLAQRQQQDLALGLERAGQTAEALAAARRGLDLAPWNEALLRCCMRLLGPDRNAALNLFEQFRQRLQAELGLQPEADSLALAQRLRAAPPAANNAAAAPIERRRVVALACELEAEDPAADPELLAHRLPALQAELSAALQARGGFVQRAEGGELLAFFGHPRAQEQAPRQALLAALQLRELLRQRQEPAAPRLGLHAGWVHADPRQSSPDGAGALSRRARRLALLAGPDEIRLSAELAAQLPPDFRCAPLAEGEARLLGQDAATTPAAAPMIGRQRELARLRQAWRQADGQALLVQGEPGLGKTRLLQALLEQPDPRAGSWLQLACQPEFQHSSPYHPCIAALRQRLLALQALHREDEAAARRRLLDEAGLDAATQAAVLERLLLPQPPTQGAPGRSGSRQEDEALLCALLGRRADGGALRLLLVEDLHWADASTLGLLARLLQRPDRPRLLLLSSREAAPPALADVETLPLEPLPPAPMRELITGLGLEDAGQIEALLRRAEGVPLYAEELARSLRQHPGEPMPGRLWDLLAARLDRVDPEARQLAQAAAVIGASFTPALLQQLHTAPAARLQRRLGELEAAGLLQRQPGSGDAATAPWQFRHALMREAAYQSLSPTPRRALHRRLADALLGPMASLGAALPALLADQLSAAGDRLAAHYWLLAGRRAATLSAPAEAAHALRQGLLALQLPPQPQGPALDALELPLQLALGNALLAAEGYGSAAARRGFERALALAGGAAAQEEARFQALWGLWLGSRSGADRDALDHARHLLEEAQRQQDPAAAAQAAYALGNNSFFLGRLAEADAWLERAAAQARPLNPGLLIGRFGEHGGITAAGLRAWVLALQGRAGEAEQQAERAVAAARDLRHAHTEAYTLAMAAVLQQRLRRPALAERHAAELLSLAETHDLAFWRAAALLVLGWAQAARGEAQGLASIQGAVAVAALAMPSTEATFLSLLADALVALRRPREALERIEEALAKARLRLEHYLEPELWRLRALALIQLGAGRAEVRTAFAQGLRRARAMGAGLLLLRGLSSRLRWQQGGAAERALRGLLRRLPAAAGLADHRDAWQALTPGVGFNAASTPDT
ncbi:AAA family ATPase [Roseateles sp. DAIF2]|uniref:AAA family ATPase n=1 Tax=Roseateles sp. DAIF2 TaxID=2714952 RepID=UPI0018A2AAE9|nr:AAA family ATPase [Roseateles sp. DAIF2]QPF72628.1 AAA family ATPase [Roseateles sp. DAIF2]